MYWIQIWKSPRFVPYGANLAHFGPKIWSPWLGELQMKQQNDLIDAREITAFWPYFRENHTVGIGNKQKYIT